MENEYIEKWLKGLSERTKINYRTEIEKWLSFIKMSPKEQIEKRAKDLASGDLTERTYFENKFREYKEWLEKNTELKAGSIKTMLRTVASFFSRNGLTLVLKSGDWQSTKETEVIHKFKLSNEDVKKMYGHGSLISRSLLLTLYQSGFSEIDVSELKVEDIEGIYELPENEHYEIEKPREKTGIIQATCLSYECLHDIRSMLTERGSPKEGYIFTSQTFRKGKPIETRTINEAMKSLAEKTFGKEKAKEFKTKALRSAYNSALLRADIKSEIKDLMMGHVRQSARKHYDYDSETIKEAYSKAFEFLTVNGIQAKQDIRKLEETVQAQQTTIDNLSRQLGDTNKTIEGLQTLIRDKLINEGKIKPKA